MGLLCLACLAAAAVAVAVNAVGATANTATVAPSARNRAPAGAALLALFPGRISIERSRWVQLLGHGAPQLEVGYRQIGPGSAEPGDRLAVLAWNATTRRWVPAVDGSRAQLTDAPSPAVSGTAGLFALGLIATLDSRSAGEDRIAATARNVALIETWMANEGGLWADNPLNTSLDASRYPKQFTSSGTDTGIPIYPSLHVGIEETATTLLSNPAYADILAVLGRRSASCVAFAVAVIESPWAASHYGHDVSGFCSGAQPDLDAVSATTLRPSSSRPARSGRHRPRPTGPEATHLGHRRAPNGGRALPAAATRHRASVRADASWRVRVGKGRRR
ncbi:MAG TPA: hypothetical protein VED63_13110 [Acidimicrobiales bacterium]|nr:hypothetical protein [Acidimicrobiales bacterium]